MRFAFVAVLVVALVGGGAASAQTVYSQNFESGVLGSEWSGAGTIQSTQGLSAFGFGTLHLKNDGQAASILTLSSLAPHTSMTISFSLAMWDSIDFPGDLFQVQVNGSFVINEGFGNYFPVSGSAGPGTQITPPTDGSFTDPQLGYNTGFRDSARAVSITFDDAATNATISFQFPNSQTAPDESFGIDNVAVSISGVAVPEPSIVVMASLGAVGLATAAYRRRRRRGRKVKPAVAQVV